jgi:hypothetical protein
LVSNFPLSLIGRQIVSLCIPVFLLRLFLFEEAAESTDGLGGILRLRQ